MRLIIPHIKNDPPTAKGVVFNFAGVWYSLVFS